MALGTASQPHPSGSSGGAFELFDEPAQHIDAAPDPVQFLSRDAVLARVAGLLASARKPWPVISVLS